MNLSSILLRVIRLQVVFLTETSDKGTNPQELVIGIVFRGAAGTQGAIHSSKYRFLHLNAWFTYFYSFLKEKTQLNQHPK